MSLKKTLGIFTVALTLLLSVARPAVLADSPPLPIGSVRFNHINVEQGLPNSRVLSILQDRQGFMWFGTAEGLARYDGYDFTLYQSDADNPQSLSNNVVWALYEDHEGSLWVGTEGGLNRFDPTLGRFTRYQHDPDNPQSLSDDIVLSIYEDRQGVLWVGTMQGGLNRFDRTSQTFTHYQNDPTNPQSLASNEVSHIVEDRNGTLWLGTYGGGLNQLLPGANQGDPPTFRRFQYDPANPQSLSNDQVETLYIDRAGAIWVGTWGGGLNRFDPNSETFTHYGYGLNPDDPDSLSSGIITQIAEGQTGELWVGTWDGGLNRFDRTSETFTHYQHDPADLLSLSHDSIRSLYISRDGLLYAGTAGGGLNVLDLEQNAFRTLRNRAGDPNSLSQNDVRKILQDREGRLWVGTNSGGLNLYDPSTGLLTHYRHNPNDPTSLSGNTIWAMVETRAGDLWVGTFGGLDKLDRQTGRFVHYQHDSADPRSLSDNTIYSLYEDHTGTLWVGTYNGLNRFDPQTQRFTRYLSDPADPHSLRSNIITSFYEDGSGALWVGTQGGGLNRMDRATGSFTHYLYDPNDSSTISNNTIPAIYGDPSGVLWLGTYNGLNAFDPKSGQAVRYTAQDGLPSGIIWGILPDEQGNLWLSTNQGLVRFNPRTKAIRVFDTTDGLVSATFSPFAFAASSTGELLFGSAEGMVILSPTLVRDEQRIPPLVFTDFQLANRPVPIGGDSFLQQTINKTKSLTLSYLDRVISFSFAALDFRAPEKIRYRYVLRGFDTRWTEVDSKRRFVTYTNLTPGNYVFLVQSSDQQGNWVTPGRALQLAIVPPWWQSLWFRLMLGGLLAIFAVASYRFRIMMLQQRTSELEDQVKTKTTSLHLLNTTLERSIVELSTLNRIAHILNRMGPTEVMMEQLAVIITRLFHGLGVAIYLQDDDQAELDIIDYYQRADPDTPDAPADQQTFQIARARVPLPENFFIQELFRDEKAVIVNTTQPDVRLPAFSQSLEQFNAAHLMLVPLHVRGAVAGAIAVVREQSSEDFTPDDVNLAETIANQMAAAVENRRLFSEEHRQREVAERRSHEITPLLSISPEVSSMLELEPLLDLILQRLEQVIDFSSLLLFEYGGEDLFILAERGLLPSALGKEDEFPADWFQEETQLFTTRRPLIVADLAQDRHLQEGMRHPFGDQAASLFRETHACLIVPMVARDQVVGLLWFNHNEPDRYTESQADYITAIAHQAAIAIENAHHHQEMQSAAVDRERTRLAQELHDSVSQTLLAANLLAKSLPALWEQSPEKGKETLRQLHRMLGNALAEMRSLMLELRPAILGQKPLSEILRQLSDGFTGRSEAPVQLNLHGDTILPAICQVAFYRIAQGALNNILQHAHASQVTIELNCTPQYVVMQISDNGVGFDLNTVSPDRMGLTIMRDRAEKIGACFQLDSQPGQGTQITVRYDYPIG
ncbi:MAG TPA: two-component regulator propeller domain-containing protein [Caldilineaceae bacterium]|nr:two-component regulator propeller domain-containing protein [Caldilineaceae bacterium]